MKSKIAFAAYLFCSAILLNGLAFVSAERTGAGRTASEPAQSEQARSLLDRGRKLLRSGDSEHALGPLEQALKLFEQANDSRGKAIAHDALGDLYNRQGLFKVALEHYQNAQVSYSAASDAYNANLMFAKIGDMHYREGNLSEASSAYGRMSVKKPDTSAVGTAKEAQSKVSRGGGLLGRVKSIATGTPSASTVSSAAAVGTDIQAEIKQTRETYRQFITYAVYETGIGKVDFGNRQFDSAKKHFENALAAADNPIYGRFGQARRWRVASRTSLGDIALAQGRATDAIKFYSAAIEGARRDNRPDLMWPAQRGLGLSHWALAEAQKDEKRASKAREDAITVFREAINTVESIRQGSLKADESRTSFLATTKIVFDNAAGALAERALISAAGGGTLQGPALNDAAEAFRITEQGRARSLLDMLAETGVDLTEGVPADLLKRRQDNLSRQQEIADVLTGATISEDAQTKKNEDLEAELAQLETEFDSIENQIRAASPRYAALTLPQPLSVAEVQQQVLDDDTVLLEYSLGEKNSYLWVVGKNNLALYLLPSRSAIEKQAVALRDQILSGRKSSPIVAPSAARGLGLSDAAVPGPAAAFVAASNSLYKTIVEPAKSAVAGKRMMIVADGALNYVPFEALVTEGGGSDYSALPYLIGSHEVVYAPSASVVAVSRRVQGKAQGRGVLLVADPVFDPGDPRARGAAGTQTPGAETRGLGLASAVTEVAGSSIAPGSQFQLKRLNGTRVEAEQIAKLARSSGGQADVWLDLDANESGMKTRDLRNYRVVHIATHGVLNAERPQFTGLVLSLVGNKTNDGFLRTGEVFNLKLSAPLVMLSACETGLGKEKRGEGVIGLTRAFMYAGSPTIGVSLWSVADRSTAELMSDFYKRLWTGKGSTVTGAMRASQQSMIAGKKYSAPYYWAPFVLVGDWKTSVAQ